MTDTPSPPPFADLGDLPALLSGSRLPDHLRGLVRRTPEQPEPDTADNTPSHDEEADQ